MIRYTSNKILLCSARYVFAIRSIRTILSLKQTVIILNEHNKTLDLKLYVANVFAFSRFGDTNGSV